jgi:predicted transcriptional regulator
LTAGKKSSAQLPPMELAIMNILWDRGPATVQEVHAQLKGKSAYTTVQTILNTMVKSDVRIERCKERRMFTALFSHASWRWEARYETLRSGCLGGRSRPC